MRGQQDEFRTVAFACSLVGRTVQVDLTDRVLYGDGGEKARATIRTVCGDLDACPIATKKGNGTSYDMNRCEFLKAEERRKLAARGG